MPSWPTGVAVIVSLLREGRLQRITGTPEGSRALLDAAARSLDVAAAALPISADDAFALSYDAARKSLTAVLHAQGLRPTTVGGHVAVQTAIEAQFTEPPPRLAFRPYGRLRSTRNRVEYEPVSSIDRDDAEEALAAARSIHRTATALVPALPVFVD